MQAAASNKPTLLQWTTGQQLSDNQLCQRHQVITRIVIGILTLSVGLCALTAMKVIMVPVALLAVSLAIPTALFALSLTQIYKTPTLPEDDLLDGAGKSVQWKAAKLKDALRNPNVRFLEWEKRTPENQQEAFKVAEEFLTLFDIHHLLDTGDVGTIHYINQHLRKLDFSFNSSYGPRFAIEGDAICLRAQNSQDHDYLYRILPKLNKACKFPVTLNRLGWTSVFIGDSKKSLLGDCQTLIRRAAKGDTLSLDAWDLSALLRAVLVLQGFEKGVIVSFSDLFYTPGLLEWTPDFRNDAWTAVYRRSIEIAHVFLLDAVAKPHLYQDIERMNAQLKALACTRKDCELPQPYSIDPLTGAIRFTSMLSDNGLASPQVLANKTQRSVEYFRINDLNCPGHIRTFNPQATA